MKELPVGQFKSKFSDLLADVQKGQEVVITFGKKKTKVAVLIPYHKYEGKKKRKLGLLKKKARFEVYENFKMTNEEFFVS